MKLYPTDTRPLDTIVPYWRNPRRVPDDAVNAIAESIARYGYSQPIVVDGDSVIIIGHTRYAALRRLGVTEAAVMVADDLPPDKVRQLRVIDNKVAENTSWDFDALVAELGDLDETLMRSFFPEVDPDALTDPGLADATDTAAAWEKVEPDVDFVCPSCFHSFAVHVTRDAVFGGTLTKDPA